MAPQAGSFPPLAHWQYRQDLRQREVDNIQRWRFLHVAGLWVNVYKVKFRDHRGFAVSIWRFRAWNNALLPLGARSTIPAPVFSAVSAMHAISTGHSRSKPGNVTVVYWFYVICPES